ncbi:ABC transporter permease [candidate division KSB1 bacterium]
MNNKEKKYPKIATWFLSNFIPGHDQRFLIGDLKEIYISKAEEKGKVYARIWYWYFLVSSIPYFGKNSIFWRFTMFKNYLKTAFRNMKRQKVFSLINISGLAIGMACSILILFWVQDELSYDKFHINIDRIYRIVDGIPVGKKVDMSALTAPPVAPALTQDYPEILEYTRFSDGINTLVKYGDKAFYETLYTNADPGIFKIFSFFMLKGDPETALSDPYSVVLTEKTAEKYFGEEDPLGKTLNINNEFNVTVTGVVKNLPQNSTIQFDFISPFTKTFFDERQLNNWDANFHYAFVLLKKGVSAENLDNKISNYLIEHDPEQTDTIDLQWFGDTHLYSQLEHEFDGLGDIKYVYIFSVLAVFVLLIACINFVNLTTAKSGSRSKEIGVRKVVGADKKDLRGQFFSETIIMTFIGLTAALILVWILLPFFNELSGKQIDPVSMNLFKLLGLFASIALLTGIISGIYPSLYLSSFQPVKALKGNFTTGKGGKVFRKILVVFQFLLSIILIICTITVSKQLNFINNFDLGYNKDHIVEMRITGDMNQNFLSFKNELLSNPVIKNVTRAMAMPNNIGSSPGSPEYEGKEEGDNWYIRADFADFDYFETFGMEIIQGRSFTKEHLTSDYMAYIVNEEAVKRMGMTDPIGKRFSFWGDEGQIIGVVKNFHFRPVHYKIEPIVYRLMEPWYRRIIVKINQTNISHSLSFIEDTWKKHFTKYPFIYSFFDKRFEAMYKAENNMGKLISYASILAIFIACLGLFGLAAFMTEQRTKEIGIRKVLGSTLVGVVYLLTKDFTKLVLLGNLVAWPIAWFAMRKWLQSFAYSIELSIYIFISAGFIALFIAFLTVSYQSLKAALSNTVDALKYE